MSQGFGKKMIKQVLTNFGEKIMSDRKRYYYWGHVLVVEFDRGRSKILATACSNLASEIIIYKLADCLQNAKRKSGQFSERRG